MTSIIGKLLCVLATFVAVVAGSELSQEQVTLRLNGGGFGGKVRARDVKGRWYRVLENDVPELQTSCATVDFFRYEPKVLALQASQFDADGSPSYFNGPTTIVDGKEFRSEIENFPAVFSIVKLKRNKSGKLMHMILFDYETSTVVALSRNVNVFNKFASKWMEKFIANKLGVPVRRVPQKDCRYFSTTVREVDIEAYVGGWYQMIGTPSSFFFGIEKCITAFYEIVSDVEVSVKNAGIRNPIPIPLFVEGKAVVTTPLFPGQLKVFLTLPFGIPIPGVNEPGDYWIVELGPVVDGKYDYALVQSPDQSPFTLFVLGRDPANFKAKYEAEITERLISFYKYNPDDLIVVPQGTGCIYTI